MKQCIFFRMLKTLALYTWIINCCLQYGNICVDNNEIEMESESLFAEAEWSQEGQNKTVQEAWVNSLSLELERVAAVDPRPVGQSRVLGPKKAGGC